MKKINIKEMVVFALLGALMYASKALLQALPNIHLLGLLIISVTLVYRIKALYPIYIYVLLDGLFGGFSIWWLPYLYIWTILWGVTMLLPKNMPKKLASVIYVIVCGAHGFLFGTLYAPAQALFYGLNFESTIAWIVAGFPYDMIHGISNIITGFFIVPLAALLRKCDKAYIRN